MKQLVLAATLGLLAGCAGLTDATRTASPTSANPEELPLYLQNPANCAEAGLYCRRR